MIFRSFNRSTPGLSSPGSWFAVLVCAILFAALPVLSAHAQELNWQRVKGLASDLSIAGDGAVFVLDAQGDVYRQRPGANSVWSKAPGRFVRLRGGLDGSIYGVSAEGRLYRYQRDAWVLVAQGVIDVAAGPDGALTVVTDQGQVRSASSAQDGDFDKTGQRFDQVVVDHHGLAWAWGAQALWRFDGTQVVRARVDGQVPLSLAFDIDGVGFAVGASGQVLRWSPGDDSWAAVSASSAASPAVTSALKVAIGPGGQPWVMAQTGVLWAAAPFASITAQGASPPPSAFTRLLSFKRMRGLAEQVSIAADGTVFSVDARQNAWRWREKDNWQMLPLRMRRVVGSSFNGVFGLSMSGRMARFDNGYWRETPIEADHIGVNAKGDMWLASKTAGLIRVDLRTERVSQGPKVEVRSIAVSPAGEPLVAAATGLVQIWRGEQWQAFPGIEAVSVAIGPEGTIYAAAAGAQLFWWDTRESLWKPATGAAKLVAVGPKGAPWIISPDGDLLASSFFLTEAQQRADVARVAALPAPPVLVIAAPAAALPSPTRQTGGAYTFTSVVGAFSDVAVGGNGAAFAVGTDTRLYCFEQPNNRFVPIPGVGARRVAVSPAGEPWVVTADQSLMRLQQGQWRAVPAVKAHSASFGSDGVLYVVSGADKRLYRYAAATDTLIAVAASADPKKEIKRAAVGGAATWIVNPAGGLERCTALGCEVILFSATDVAVAQDGTVLVADVLQPLKRWDGRVRQFLAIGPQAKAVAAAPGGAAWIVNLAGGIGWSGSSLKPDARVNPEGCSAPFLAAPSFAGSRVGVTAASVPFERTLRPDVVVGSRVVDLNPGEATKLLMGSTVGVSPASPVNASVTWRGSSLLRLQLDATLLLDPSAAPGTTIAGEVGVCARPLLSPCATATFTVRVRSQLLASDDAQTLAAGQRIDLLANDRFNGAAVRADQVTIQFVGSSVLQQSGGAVVLSAQPSLPGTYTASYAWCLVAQPAACSNTANVKITVASELLLRPDVATLNPGGSLNLLGNDSLNGAVPLASQLALTYTGSPNLSLNATSGVLSVSNGAPTGATQQAQYRACVLPAGSPCATATVSITVPGVLNLNNDAATLSPGGSLNLLSNDSLNGAAPLASQLALTYTGSPNLSLSSVSGVLSVSNSAPTGTTLQAQYRACVLPVGLPCATATVSITVPGVLNLSNDVATLNPGGSLNLLSNDSLNGAAPLASQLALTYTGSPNLSLNSASGVLSVANSAPTGTTLQAQYRACVLPTGLPCATATVSITVPGVLNLNSDVATLNPGGSLNLLGNDGLNGAVPLASQLALTYTGSPNLNLNSVSGVLSVSNSAPTGTTLQAQYRACVLPAGFPCATATVSITVPGVLNVNNDAATLNPGGSLNLLGNDSLNGAVPLASQLALTFAGSANLSLNSASGVLSVANSAPTGTTLQAQYRACVLPTGLPCATATVSITVPGVLNLSNDVATLNPGGSLNLLSNDSLNGAAPLASQLALTYTGSPNLNLNAASGVLSVANSAPTGTTLQAQYRACVLPTGLPCATAMVSITVPGVLNLSNDVATLNPGGSLNLLSNDSLNGAAPLASQLALTYTGSPNLSLNSVSGVLSVSNSAPTGTTLQAQYQACVLPTGLPCATATVSITVPGVLNLNNDAATLNPGGSLNLLSNDSLNGAAPLASQLALTYTGSPNLSLNSASGVLSVSNSAPTGTTLQAQYRACVLPAGSSCATATVNITVPGVLNLSNDVATLNPGGSLNLLSNDSLNGAVPLASQLALTYTGSPNLNLNAVSGVLSVSNSAPTGTTLQAQYRACVLPAGLLCATATVSITIPSRITSLPDAATLTLSDSLAVYANDLVDGQPATVANSTLSFTALAPQLAANAGVLALQPDAQPGASYAASYVLCSRTTPAICGVPTPVVVARARSIALGADTLFRSAGEPAGLADLTGNDTLGGASVSFGSLSLVVTPFAPSGITVSAFGAVAVDYSVPAGTYTSTYRACNVRAASTDCASTTVTVVVGISILAVDDSADLGAGGSLNVLRNDSVNGSAATPANVSVNQWGVWPPYASLNTSFGIVGVSAGYVGASTTDVQYQICARPGGLVCHIGTVSIAHPPTVVANPDTLLLGLGANASVLVNDTLNGGPFMGNGQVTSYSFPTLVGIAAISPAGVLTLTPLVFPLVNPAFNSVHNGTYTVCQTSVPGNCASTTVQVTVEP